VCACVRDTASCLVNSLAIRHVTSSDYECMIWSAAMKHNTEVFPCFFLSFKTNARLYLAKTGHGPHSSELVNSVVLCIVCVDCVVLCIVCLLMCTVLLPAGVNPIAVKYIISYHLVMQNSDKSIHKFLLFLH